MLAAAIAKRIFARAAIAARRMAPHDAPLGHRYVLPQANKPVLESIKEFGASRFSVLSKPRGNTVSSTNPLTLQAMRAEGHFQTEKTVILPGVGVAFSWAGCMLHLRLEQS